MQLTNIAKINVNRISFSWNVQWMMTLGNIVKGLGLVFNTWLYYYWNQYLWTNHLKLNYCQNELNIIYLSYILPLKSMKILFSTISSRNQCNKRISHFQMLIYWWHMPISVDAILK